MICLCFYVSQDLGRIYQLCCLKFWICAHQKTSFRQTALLPKLSVNLHAHLRYPLLASLSERRRGKNCASFLMRKEARCRASVALVVQPMTQLLVLFEQQILKRKWEIMSTYKLSRQIPLVSILHLSQLLPILNLCVSQIIIALPMQRQHDIDYQLLKTVCQ